MSNPHNLIQVVLAEEAVIKHAIEFKDFSIFYDQQILLDSLTLNIQQGEWLAILGRSGCGKTTLLKSISHLIDLNCHSSGTMKLSSKDDISYMLQNDSLLPWLTVIDNILLYHKFHRNIKVKDRAHQLLDVMGLAKYAHSYPHILSGGMRQRVSLARTLIQDKSIILMDEPFASLDALTRRELHLLCKDILKNKTVIIVTHDPNEATFLTDQIYIMHQQTLSKAPLTASTAKQEEALIGMLLQQDKSTC